MKLPRFSIGMGDRFAHQGVAQLEAVQAACQSGIELSPVWNKSNREHQIIGSSPDDVRTEADAAVKELLWSGPYFVDADHIGLGTVDRFLPASDFFTIDVADFTGKPAPEDATEAFVSSHSHLIGNLEISGLSAPLSLTRETLQMVARKFLLSIQEAGNIYRHIENAKGADNFVTEVSIDETDSPQTPPELLLILAMVAAEGIPAATVAPKFTGRFNKGVDYVGDVDRFAREFEDDLAIIAYAVEHFGLPEGLKLSVHSGSDKFTLYPIIRRAVQKTGAGLHLKTAGTTWLEEVIGLAESGGKALKLATDIYAGAHAKFEELAAPYASVIDIDPISLPIPSQVAEWNSEQFVSSLRHNQDCPEYNPHFRQLLHIGFKVAAQMGDSFTDALKENREVIARNVTANLLERHIHPAFGS